MPEKTFDPGQRERDARLFRHILPPSDARRLCQWEQADDGRWAREFSGSQWLIELPGEPKCADQIDLEIAGFQHDNGTATRYLYLEADAVQITPEQARRLAAALLNAADEIEALP